MESGFDPAQSVRVNFYATLRAVVGGKTIQVDLPVEISLDALLQRLTGDYPALNPVLFHADGSLQQTVHIFINGRDAHLLPDHLSTRLHPGDRLDIFPPVGGG